MLGSAIWRGCHSADLWGDSLRLKANGPDKYKAESLELLKLPKWRSHMRDR